MAYVQAIAAQAGLNTKTPRWDDGIDIEIGSNKPLISDMRIRNLYICLQLKATENWKIDADSTIPFNLKASNYEQLRSKSIQPQYLVLYTLPHSRAYWVLQRPDYSQFNHVAYFADLTGLPALGRAAGGRERKSRVVRVPIGNRLTAASLLRLYRDACWKSLRFGGGRW